MTRIQVFFSLGLIFPTSPLLVSADSEGWYQECDDGGCGYSQTRGGANNDCHDLHSECRDFALRGECFANPLWMQENCLAACGLCPVETSPPCRDLHPNCPTWAEALECYTTPGYMVRACPKSCWLCVNTTELQEAGMQPEEIQQRIRFSQTDFGLWQSIPDDNEPEVKAKVQRMGRYMMNLKNLGAGTVCNNVYHDCATWAQEGKCLEDMDFMLPHCSLACQYCDVIETYHTCRRHDLAPGHRESFGDLNSVVRHLLDVKQAKNLLQDEVELQEGEWIMSLKREALWDNPEKELEELIGFLQSKESPLEWKPATAENFTDFPSDVIPDRTGQTVVCPWCQSQETIPGSLTTSIASLLQIPPIHLQPLEFVHYKRGERFAVHHDYRVHDRWKHSGNHILTVFVALQNPTKGGAMGFPEMDWLQIHHPEVLVWPSIAPGKPNEGLRRMKSEQLPVVEGDMFGVYAWVRQYPYDHDNPCA